MATPWSKDMARNFFADSMWLDAAVLRPLQHIAPNWELTWSSDNKCYEPECYSLADHLNVVIEEISSVTSSTNYHKIENDIARHYRGVKGGAYRLSKKGRIWFVSATSQMAAIDEVGHMIEQASASWYDVQDLIYAAAGRVAAAMKHGQKSFDEMDEGHMTMLSVIIATIIFRRSDRQARPS